MPPQVPRRDAVQNVDTSNLKDVNMNYDYPNGLDLRPGTDLHDKIANMVKRFANSSHQAMSQRHNDWTEIDKVLKSYTYNAPVGSLRNKKGRDADGEVSDTMRRIVMPVSLVVLETLLTYMTSAFFRPPVFRYEGTGPEDVLGALLMTEVVDKHVHRNAVPLSLHTAFRDAFAYGVSYASPRWHVEKGRVMETRVSGFLDPVRALLTNTFSRRRQSTYRTIYEGNVLDNIDPYLALPDPNISPHEIQNSEFFGWVEETLYSPLRRREAAGEFFNVKYLKLLADKGGDLRSNIRNYGERGKSENANSSDSSTPVHIIRMYIDLVPKDHELGSGEDPETWVFTVAGDKIVIQAERLNLVHGKIPVASAAPDFDGYSVAPMSRLLAIEELQQLIDFLYTSHMENKKRVINDNLVVDPSLINIHDVNDNRPGKIIRVLKKGWGQSSLKDNAIFQLDVQDVTQTNVSDAAFLMQEAKTATSTMDQMLGQLQPRTTRVSASEAQGLRQSGLSRLERPAQIISYQFMQPIARMFASNVQQFMSEEVFVKTVGDLKQQLQTDFGMETTRNRARVRPIDLIVDYDVLAHDGAIPGKNNTEALIDMFTQLAQNPQLAQQFDVQRIFKHIMREAGVKNVEDFIPDRVPTNQPPVDVLPDEQVVQEAERGNIQPSGI